MIDQMTADEIARLDAKAPVAENPPADNPDNDQRAAITIIHDLAAAAGMQQELLKWIQRGDFRTEKNPAKTDFGVLAVGLALTEIVGRKSSTDFAAALDALKKLYAKNPAAVKSVVDSFKHYATTDAKIKKIYHGILGLDPYTFNFIDAE